MSIIVKKASGKKEKFDEIKVRNSLKRAGAKPEVINKILIALTSFIQDSRENNHHALI